MSTQSGAEGFINPSLYNLLVVNTNGLDLTKAGRIRAFYDGEEIWNFGWLFAEDRNFEALNRSLLSSLNSVDIPAEGTYYKGHMLIGLLKDLPDLQLFEMIGENGATNIKWSILNPVSNQNAGNGLLDPEDMNGNGKSDGGISPKSLLFTHLAAGLAGYYGGKQTEAKNSAKKTRKKIK